PERSPRQHGTRPPRPTQPRSDSWSSELPLSLLELGGLAELPAAVTDPPTDPAHQLAQADARIPEHLVAQPRVREQRIGCLGPGERRLDTHLRTQQEGQPAHRDSLWTGGVQDRRG